jgi:hypothetical protein
VKKAGLWAPHLPKEYGGMGLDFLAHAYMNEVLAYAIGAASLFGVVAPNSGNQSILVKYGTEEQKQEWLLPLIDGTMESGFSMTEPHNPGSDPRSLDHGRSGRRRRLRDQRPQVVHLATASTPTSSSSCAACREGRHRSAKRTDGADHRADGHQGRQHRARHRRVGSQGERPLRGEVRPTCACRSPTRSVGWARATRPRRTGSAPVGSTTA